MAANAARDPRPPRRGWPGGAAPAPRPAGPGPVLELAFDYSTLDALRAAVAAHAVLAGLAPLQADDLVLIAHELAANAVLHGAGHGRLRAWRHGQAVHCEVTDDGPRADDGAARPPRRSTAPPGAAWWPAEHGHGLWVVSQLTDESSLRFGPGGTSASARFLLPGP